jgi:hypothetical protein
MIMCSMRCSRASERASHDDRLLSLRGELDLDAAPYLAARSPDEDVVVRRRS